LNQLYKCGRFLCAFLFSSVALADIQALEISPPNSDPLTIEAYVSVNAQIAYFVNLKFNEAISSGISPDEFWEYVESCMKEHLPLLLNTKTPFELPAKFENFLHSR